MRRDEGRAREKNDRLDPTRERVSSSNSARSAAVRHAKERQKGKKKQGFRPKAGDGIGYDA